MVDGSWSMVDGMRERPILMTPENAQKCHEGTKTQTRRIIRVPSWASDDDMLKLSIQRPATGIAYYVDGMPVKRLTCPYGVVGDRLWVREAWQEKAWTLTQLNSAGLLNAPMKPKETYLNEPIYAIHRGGYNYKIGDPGRWFPSIHMPRWACRTVLEITDVRVERLQEINLEDCQSEGVRCESYTGPPYCTWCSGHEAPCHRDAYKTLWESINGVGSWALNPWVWVLCFKKV